MKKLNLFVLLLSFCCGLAFAETTVNGIVVTDAYVQAVIPGQTNAAAYMKINNQTGEDFILVGAQSPVAARVELHTISVDAGVVKMRPVESIKISHGQSLLFEPGDFHIMLMNVNTTLTKDTKVPLCLLFQGGAKECIEVPVKEKRKASKDKVKVDHAH